MSDRSKLQLNFNVHLTNVEKTDWRDNFIKMFVLKFYLWQGNIKKVCQCM